MQGDIGSPYVVLAVDGNAVRHHEVVCTQRSQEFSVESIDDEDGGFRDGFGW